MSEAPRTNVWDNGGAYERYVGRWSRLVAREFLSWLAVPAGSRWLDVGCGTGVLSETILEAASPNGVAGIDQSTGFVAYARKRIADHRARFTVGDARSLPIEGAVYDAVVSGLVLNFVPEPERAVAEMARVARSGGGVGVYVWDYGGQMQLMRFFWDAAVALNPEARDLDEGRRFPICRPSALEALFHQAELADVTARAIEIPTVFRDFDDYWAPFLGRQGPAPGYVASLDDSRRDELRKRLQETLPVASDGSIRLTARAWAVRGRR